MNYKRKEQINNFLLKYRTLLKTTDEFLINSKSLYNYLVRINTDYNDNNYDLFDKWFEYGENIDSLTFFTTKPVRVQSEMKSLPYFIGINTKNNNLIKDPTTLHKIYLSLKPEYLEDGVKRLIEFFDRENIEVSAKVGRLSRDDQIVIRVGNHKDCDKVINFINNDQYIQMGKKEANPFSFQKDGIALAADGEVSYNTCISRLVYKYLQYMKYKNRVDYIGYSSFIKYIKNYYEKHFIKNENIDEALRDFKVKDDKAELYKLIDYKYCIRLLIDSLSDEFDYDSYKRFIDYKHDRFAVDSRDLYFKHSHENYFSLFFELCDVMINKVGFESATFNIVEFLENNNSDYITGDNNLRRRVDNRLFINFIKNHVSRNNMTIEEFINSIYYPENDLNYDEKESIINDGIRKTYLVHNDDGQGLYYARGALYNLIIKNKYNGFTREDGVRDRIKECISRDDLINIVKNETGMNTINEDTIHSVVDTYIDGILKSRVL